MARADGPRVGEPGRREFVRLAGMGALGFLAACKTSTTPGGGASPAASPAGTTPAPSPTQDRALRWRRVRAEGPPARRDYSFVADDSGTAAFLFGGRAGGDPLGDLWRYDVRGESWKRIRAEGPSPRFGANAAFVEGRLLLFGGQGGAGEFFDDTWTFEPGKAEWTSLRTKRAPAERYGAGGTRVGSRFLISHGFTDSGRFDDTWSFGDDWRNVSPSGGRRPVERCLHRIAYLGSARRVVLFGGQTTGTPFLGDTWLYDPDRRRWVELPGRGPGRRNLYALGATPDALYLFGGYVSGGARDDLWLFNGSRWREIEPRGKTPGRRGGVDAAMLPGPNMLTFGGNDGSDDLDDLWELTIA